jgi:phage tail protein X
MSVVDTTFSRTNLREWAFTTDHVLAENRDHVFSHSPTLSIFAGQTLVSGAGGVPLSGAGKSMAGGGHRVVMRVRLGEHAGAKRGASAYDTHNVAPDDNTQLAEAVWRFYTHGLTIAQHELRINSGIEAWASFLEDQTQSVMLALADILATDLHATTSTTNGITSLDDLIDAGQASVQGLAQTSYANYNARGVSARGTAAASVSFATGSFAAQGLADWRTAFNNASEGLVQPDVVVTDYATFERYEGALQPQERFAGTATSADGSFITLGFKGKPVLADPKTASGRVYFLKVGGNDGISLKILEGTDFAFGEWKPSSNQNVMVRPLEVTCALINGNLRRSNKLTGTTD